MELSPITTVLLFLTPAFLAAGVIYIWLKIQQRKNRRPPFTKDFLRSPGETLRKQIDDLRDKFNDLLLELVIFPVIGFVLWISLDKRYAWVSLIIVAIFIIYKIVQLVRLVNKNKVLRLGWEGERAVGEELNQLMLQGYRVFHDIPKELRGNVDHVVIGPNGVFAVETKAISKDRNAKGADAVKITFDGKQMVFPDGRKLTDPLDQSRRHAIWLKKFLTSSTGETFAVTPVVVIPGWFINRTGPSKEVFLLSGGEIQTAFSKLPGQKLNALQIQRIAHQLDRLCRSVEPWKALSKKSS